MIAMAGRCSSCIHWERDIYYPNGPHLFGICDKILDIYPDSDRLSDGISVDGDGYTPTVSTGQDFGCIHWQAVEHTPR